MSSEGGCCNHPGQRDRGLAQGGCSGCGELCSDSGYILEIELAGHADGVGGKEMSQV